MILYDYDSNSINSQPMKSKHDLEMIWSH
jgi:hypothetical protein